MFNDFFHMIVSKTMQYFFSSTMAFLQSNHKYFLVICLLPNYNLVLYRQSVIYILSYEKKKPRISTGSQKIRGRAGTFPLPNRKMIANTSAKDVKIMKDAVRNTTYLTS